MEATLQGILSFTNDTFVKTLLLMFGGLMLKRWPAFVNKAIPTTKLMISAALAILAALFPTQAATAVPASFVFSTFAGAPLYATASWTSHLGSVVSNTLVPLAFAIAAHSGPKNTGEWIKLGVGFFWPGGRPAGR